MDDILHKYTAGEFLKWLSHEQADKYIETDIVSLDDENETAPIEKFSIEELSSVFYLFQKAVFTRNDKVKHNTEAYCYKANRPEWKCE